MTIYLFIPLIAMLSFYLVSGFQIQEKLIQKNVDLSIFLSFVIPFILFAFRDASIGIDTKTYLAYLDQIHNLSFSQVMDNRRFELGYTIFCYVVTRLSNYKFIFLIITSLIMNFLYARSIVVLSPMPLTSTLIYFFVSNFLYNLNILRQGIAVGIVLFSMQYLRDQQYKKYFWAIVAASLIHTFTIIFIPLLLLAKLVRKKRQILIFCVIGTILIFITLQVVYEIVQRFFPHFVYYFKNDFHNNRNFGITSLAYVILDIFLFISLIMSYEKYEKKNKELINILCMSVSFGAASLIMINKFGIYERIARVFHAFLLLAVPYAAIGIKNKYTRYVILLVVLMCTFIYYVYLIGTNAYLIVPYKFFFAK